MAPASAVIDVWVADASDSCWASSCVRDWPHPDHLSAVGRKLAAAVLAEEGGEAGPSNLSHSGRRVVFAVGRGVCITHLGVDVETRRDLPRPQAFANRILAEGEAAGARDLIGAWTVKEAALKATSVGLSGDPRAWRFDHLDSSHPRLRAAPSEWSPASQWAFLRTDIEGEASLALAVRLDTIQALDVAIRPVRDLQDVADRSRTPLRLTWSPLCFPATS